MIRRTIPCVAVLTVAAAFCCGGAASAKDKPVSWKPILEAVFRINGSAPQQDWAVYQAGKKSDPLLIRIGDRILVLEIQDRRVFQLDPSKIDLRPGEVLWNPSDLPAEPLPAANWQVSDSGGVYEISVTLDNGKTGLDLQLPPRGRVGPSAPSQPPAPSTPHPGLP